MVSSGYAAWKLILNLLLIVYAHRSVASEMIEMQSEEFTVNGYEDHGAHERMHKNDLHAHPSSHMNHMDPSSMVFFTLKDLKVGKTMPVYFRYRDLSASTRMLPREEADSIPFSSKQLPYLLDLFSYSHESPQARAMEDTLNQCETNPIEGEVKTCPTSLESMLDFARNIFGLGNEFKVVRSRRLTRSTTVFQNYTILEVPQEIPAPKMIACHIMPYPYTVFYCHSQQTENKLFNVSLGGETGDRMEAIAVCHMDTSKWSHDHASFRALGIKPGSSHVCHFFQTDNFIFVPASSLVNYVYAM